MTTPDYEEVCAAVAAAPKGKATGKSKVSGDLLKRLGPLGQALFVVLVQACFVQGRMPDDWLKGVILVLSRHSIFRGPNFSVLKGTMTKDPIHILNSVLEDAREHKKEVWVLLQDMKRCFDSVSCQPGGMLELGLRHLKIPEPFIRLCLYVAEHKTNQIITAYGLTEEYSPRCGLDQGGVESPLLWRVVYEVLLARVWQSNLGYPMVTKADLRLLHKIPKFDSVHLDASLLISCLAFMDDTNWLAPSKANLYRSLDSTRC